MPSDSFMKATVFDDGESSMPLRRRVEKKDEIIELDAGLQILTSHPSILGDYETEVRADTVLESPPRQRQKISPPETDMVDLTNTNSVICDDGKRITGLAFIDYANALLVFRLHVG